MLSRSEHWHLHLWSKDLNFKAIDSAELLLKLLFSEHLYFKHLAEGVAKVREGLPCISPAMILGQKSNSLLLLLSP